MWFWFLFINPIFLTGFAILLIREADNLRTKLSFQYSKLDARLDRCCATSGDICIEYRFWHVLPMCKRENFLDYFSWNLNLKVYELTTRKLFKLLIWLMRLYRVGQLSFILTGRYSVKWGEFYQLIPGTWLLDCLI